MSESIKRQLVDALVREIEESIERLKVSFESTRQAAIQAPGRMQSRYDTTKEEQSKVADGIGMQILKHEAALASVRSFSRSGEQTGDVVTTGSLVLVKSAVEEVYFLIVPSGAGRTVVVEDKEITSISPEAPIAAALLGHRSGDQVIFTIGTERRTLTILSVC